MRTLGEMAGVITPPIFLHTYEPLGWLEDEFRRLNRPMGRTMETLDGRRGFILSFMAPIASVSVNPGGWSQDWSNEKGLSLSGFAPPVCLCPSSFLAPCCALCRPFLYWQNLLMKCHLRQLANTIDVPESDFFCFILSEFSSPLPSLHTRFIRSLTSSASPL